MAKVIIGLIVATFALFGVESILTSGGIAYVAEVNGEGIAASELQQQINQQKDYPGEVKNLITTLLGSKTQHPN